MARSQMSLTVISSKARSKSSAISASHSNLWVRRTRKSACSKDVFIDTFPSDVAYPTQRLLLLLDWWCFLKHTRKRDRSKDTRLRVDEYAKATSQIPLTCTRLRS